MKTRNFRVSGMQPAHGEKMNNFVKALNLGMEGVFIPFAEEVIVAINDEVFGPQWGGKIDGIKRAYEEAGYVKVKVIENTPEYSLRTQAAWLCQKCWQEYIIEVIGEAECFTDTNMVKTPCVVCGIFVGKYHLVDMPRHLTIQIKAAERTPQTKIG